MGYSGCTGLLEGTEYKYMMKLLFCSRSRSGPEVVVQLCRVGKFVVDIPAGFEGDLDILLSSGFGVDILLEDFESLEEEEADYSIQSSHMEPMVQGNFPPNLHK